MCYRGATSPVCCSQLISFATLISEETTRNCSLFTRIFIHFYPSISSCFWTVSQRLATCCCHQLLVTSFPGSGPLEEDPNFIYNSQQSLLLHFPSPSRMYKKVKQLLSEWEFNPWSSCKEVVLQLRREVVSCGSDSFCPCKKIVCFNQAVHSVTSYSLCSHLCL